MNVTLLLVLLIFLTFAMAASGLSWLMGMHLVNPITVVAMIWSTVFTVYFLVDLDLLSLRLVTASYLVSALVLVMSGAFVGWFLIRSEVRPLPAVTTARLTRFHLTGVLLLAGYVVLQVAKFAAGFEEGGGVTAIATGNALALRRALVDASLTAATERFSIASAIIGTLGYVLFVGMLSLISGAELVRRGSWQIGLLPMAVVLVLSLVTVQRFYFVYSLAILAVAYMYLRMLHGRQAGTITATRPLHERRRAMAFAIAGILLVAAIYLPLRARDASVTPSRAATSVLQYTVSGVGGLNVLLAENRPRPAAHGGVWTAWGLSTLLNRVGLAVAVPPNRLAFVNMNRKADDSFLTNVYTYIIYPYYDFGLTGVLVFSFLMGVFAGAVHRLLLLGHISLLFLGPYLMTTLLMSFFGLSLLRDFRYVFLLLGAPFAVRRLYSRNSLPAV